MNRFSLGTLLLLMVALFPAHEALALRIVDEQFVFDDLKDFDLCQQRAWNGVDCLDALDRWLDGVPSEQKAINFFQAAKQVRLHMIAWNAVPYFARFFSEGNVSEEFCQDPDLSLAVVSALALPAHGPTYGKVVVQAQVLAFGSCFSSLQGAIKEELSKTYVFRNSCRELMKRGVLGSLQTRRCQALVQ